MSRVSRLSGDDACEMLSTVFAWALQYVCDTMDTVADPSVEFQNVGHFVHSLPVAFRRVARDACQDPRYPVTVFVLRFICLSGCEREERFLNTVPRSVSLMPNSWLPPESVQTLQMLSVSNRWRGVSPYEVVRRMLASATDTLRAEASGAPPPGHRIPLHMQDLPRGLPDKMHMAVLLFRLFLSWRCASETATVPSVQRCAHRLCRRQHVVGSRRCSLRSALLCAFPVPSSARRQYWCVVVNELIHKQVCSCNDELSFCSDVCEMQWLHAARRALAMHQHKRNYEPPPQSAGGRVCRTLHPHTLRLAWNVWDHACNVDAGMLYVSGFAASAPSMVDSQASLPGISGHNWRVTLFSECSGCCEAALNDLRRVAELYAQATAVEPTTSMHGPLTLCLASTSRQKQGVAVSSATKLRSTRFRELLQTYFMDMSFVRVARGFQ